MERPQEWTFKGKTGKDYTFKVIGLSEELPGKPGIVILTYLHPNGHMAGFSAKPIKAAQGPNINIAAKTAMTETDSTDAYYNCACILVMKGDEEERKSIVEDILG